MPKPKALSEQEKHIIINKKTESPFSGQYHDHWQRGSYACRQCGQILFVSQAKFDAGCGWPSFDQALIGAVQELLDADGRRTEIVCSSCGGHLGHVFRGEAFTEQNTRHCVNSISLEFVPDEN